MNTQPSRSHDGELHIGQAVHVNARSAWLAATVVSITHTRVGVAFHHATPTPFGDHVAPWVIRPATGTRLEPVHRLRHGDDIVAFDGSLHTVAAAWQCPDGWWLVTYTNGDQATMPASAVLRLSDPTGWTA